MISLTGGRGHREAHYTDGSSTLWVSVELKLSNVMLMHCLLFWWHGNGAVHHIWMHYSKSDKPDAVDDNSSTARSRGHAGTAPSFSFTAGCCWQRPTSLEMKSAFMAPLMKPHSWLIQRISVLLWVHSAQQKTKRRSARGLRVAVLEPRVYTEYT